jgi:ubiquinone/menaquinone biosynthesis C-methylase UbiE
LSHDSGRHLFPAGRAAVLDIPVRRLVQNPRRILRSFLREGMTVLDMGCGTGYFTVPMAEMVGASGRVIAADLQEALLERLSSRIAGTVLEKRVEPHRTHPDSIGITDPVDFALLFYMVHEVPDREGLFREVAAVLKPGARALVIEPGFHVSRREFRETLEAAGSAGLAVSPGPGLAFSRSAVLERTS